MTGASLGYSGYYNGVSLLTVGEYGYWWSSTIRNANSYSYLLRIGYDNIGPQYSLNKYVGRAVRYNEITNFFIATHSAPVAPIIGGRLNQTRAIHIQAVTTGTSINSRRPVVAIQRLVVKPTSIPVVVAWIYIRQWIRSCTKATSGEGKIFCGWRDNWF